MHDLSMQQMARNYLTCCKEPSCTTPCGTTATTTMVCTTKENGLCQQNVSVQLRQMPSIRQNKLNVVEKVP